MQARSRGPRGIGRAAEYEAEEAEAFDETDEDDFVGALNVEDPCDEGVVATDEMALAKARCCRGGRRLTSCADGPGRVATLVTEEERRPLEEWRHRATWMLSLLSPDGQQEWPC